MCCLLKLRHFSGEGTNEVMRSITVVIVAVHLQRREDPCDHFSIQALGPDTNVFFKVEP